MRKNILIERRSVGVLKLLNIEVRKYEFTLMYNNLQLENAPLDPALVDIAESISEAITDPIQVPIFDLLPRLIDLISKVHSHLLDSSKFLNLDSPRCDGR